jgi:hypothetical protein
MGGVWEYGISHGMRLNFIVEELNVNGPSYFFFARVRSTRESINTDMTTGDQPETRLGEALI